MGVAAETLTPIFELENAVANLQGLDGQETMLQVPLAASPRSRRKVLLPLELLVESLGC